MSWPLTIEIGGLPPSPNRKMGWQKRRRLVKPLADAVQLQARALGLERPSERGRVLFMLIYTPGPLREADNAQASCKELLDALVRGGVLVDDGPEHVELAGIVQVFGARSGVQIEEWPWPLS